MKILANKTMEKKYYKINFIILISWLTAEYDVSWIISRYCIV